MPYNDELVITLCIDTNVRCVLVDPDRSNNIIQMRAIKEMQLDDRIVQKILLLSGFNKSSEMTKGEITLRTFTKGGT